MDQSSYNPALHRLALLTAVATFPLIFMGGLVTSHHAGMSVPDWPNSYGYNMFLFPPRLWIGGILYEHTHRLMGTVVGMLSILLVVWAWRTEPRRWTRWMALGVLGAVILQGVLGGLRVVLVNLDLAIVHACFAQAFFCFAAAMSVVTSRWWHDCPTSPSPSAPAGATLVSTGWARQASPLQEEGRGEGLFRVAVIAVIAIYLQLIAGALMRHYQAGLAIPDFPASYGHLIPPLNGDELAAINNQRAFKLNLDPVTMPQVWLHFAHRIGAALVTIAVLMLSIQTIRRCRRQQTLIVPALLLLVLLVGQITLGIVTVLRGKPADVASAHVAVGALMLMTACVMALHAGRLAGKLHRGTGNLPVLQIRVGWQPVPQEATALSV